MINLDNPSDEYSVHDYAAIFDSNPDTFFDGVYEVIDVSDDDNTITIRIDCDLDGNGECDPDEISATDPGTWELDSSPKVSNKDDLGIGFRISIGGGIDLNIPIDVTTLTLGGELTVEFWVPGPTAAEDFRIELSFTAELSETHVGPIATAACMFVVALDFDAPANEFIVIYGAARLTTELHFLEYVGLFMEANGFLRINSSNQDRSITLRDINNNLVEVALPAQSFALRLDGSVEFYINFNGNDEFETFESVFLIEGIFVLEFSAEQGFNVALFRDIGGGLVGPATLQLGPANCRFLTFNVFGFLAIRSDGFAANLILSLDVALPGPLSGLISLSAEFIFIVNTTGGEIQFDIPGDASNPGDTRSDLTLTIPGAGPANPGALAEASLNDLINGNPWTDMVTAGPYGVLFFKGELTLLYVIELSASGYVSLNPDVLSMEVAVSGSFLKLFSVSGSAFVSSEGEFEFIVDGSVQIGPNGFNIGGTAHLEVSYLDNNGKASGGVGPKTLNVEGYLTGKGEIFWIEFTIVELGVSYNSASGDITLRVGPVLVPRWGWPPWESKYYSFAIGTLKMGAPPPLVVLGQIEDINGVWTLTLNVGPNAGARNLFVDEPDEDVLIEHLSGNSVDGEQVRITMFGYSETFDNVLEILIPDMGAGEDYVEIYAGVSVPFEVHFGDDDDTLISAGSGVVKAYGDGGADRLTGGSAGDQLFGGPGNDFIDGKTGQDWIEGGDDSDFLIGGENADNINGGAGNDRIMGDQVSVTGDETASVFETIGSAFGGNDTIEGGDGADVILGGSRNDIINGGAGEDLLIGDDGIVTFSQELGMTFTLTDSDYSENDFIDGGADNDTLFGQMGEDILLGGVGDDHLYGDGYALFTETVRNILLGDGGTINTVGGLVTVDTSEESAGGADTIWGNGGADIVMGGAAMDMIYGDAGDDILLGDTGMIVLDNGSLVYVDTEDEEFGSSDTIHGDMGNDIIIGGLNGSSDALYGNDGDDIIIGDNGFIEFNIDGDPLTLDLIRSATDGFGGDDYIYGNAGSDVILGGTGDDEIHGDDDPDILIGDNADIFLSGFVPGSLTILGSAINRITTTDNQESTGGADSIYGDGGDDIIMGGAAEDTIHGGTGIDLIFGDQGDVENGSGGNWVVTYNGETPPWYEGYSYTSIQTQNGDAGAGDTIYGEDGGDYILGQQGQDVIFGGNGDDDIYGGHNVAGGHDTGDIIDGGTGNDVIVGDNASIQRTVGALNPRMRVLQGDMIYGEGLGSDGEPLVTGDSQVDPTGVHVRAVLVFDYLVTPDSNTFGDDTVAGGADDDMIFGQLGNDTLHGDGQIIQTDGMYTLGSLTEAVGDSNIGGDDYIEGNGGDDTIYGGLGQDDIIGGSSTLFGLTTPDQRPDGSDTIYGGNGDMLTRNNLGDETLEGHARDADMILGDNGNIYRLVGTNGTNSGNFLTFNYDNYGDEKIVVRAAELIDYTPGGVDYDAVNAANDIGAPDEIHGESGDDFLYGMKGDDVIFGEGQDDDIIGGYGNDWISGGTGDDGVLGDDGRIYTSRNGTAEPLYDIGNLAGELDKDISTQDKKQQATINVRDELKKTVNLTPFKLGDPEVPQYLDEFDQADDIIFGGWGNDFLHGGDGDDAISGAEALTEYYDNPVN